MASSIQPIRYSRVLRWTGRAAAVAVAPAAAWLTVWLSGLGGSVSERGAVDQDQDEIVIYWRPDCVFCLDLLLRLKFTQLRYRKVDIRKDPGAKAFVRSAADGNETVPTVVVAGRTLVNPSKRRLIEAVRTYAPQTLGTSR